MSARFDRSDGRLAPPVRGSETKKLSVVLKRPEADDEERSRGLQSVGNLLVEHKPELAVSRYRYRQLERIHRIRANLERQGERLGFTARPFVLCGLPMRRPSRGQLLFERRNGKFKLQLLGHPDCGLPFGQDRLILIFLATLAVRQQSQTLRFRSGAEMLEMCGMQKGGKEYRRLVAGIERIFGSTIFFGSERTADGAKLFSRARFYFVRETHIWFDRDSSRDHPTGNRQNVVVLSDEFFREIVEHPIPTDLEAVRLLAASPGALDLYLWITYRTFTAKNRQSIPLFGPNGLQAQLGCSEYSRPRRFRAMLMQWIAAIMPVCPKFRRMVQVSREFLELRGEQCP
jgi:hypothetical protein